MKPRKPLGIGIKLGSHTHVTKQDILRISSSKHANSTQPGGSVTRGASKNCYRLPSFEDNLSDCYKTYQTDEYNGYVHTSEYLKLSILVTRFL